MAHKIEVNGITGQQVIIELTNEEVAELKRETASIQAALQAEQDAKQAAKASALAKLAALGLTEDEIAAL
jgi:DNA-binding transcriptional regulator YhcF (GntR family)